MRTTAEPMNPAPPVTSIFMTISPFGSLYAIFPEKHESQEKVAIFFPSASPTKA
jgi:hypothetical protein